MSVVTDKASVRAAALQRRDAVTDAVRRAAALHLAETGMSLVLTRGGRDLVVSVYQPIRGEVETAALLSALAREGFRTALPVTQGRDQPLRFRLWQAGEPLSPGRWRIPEPPVSAAPADPDVLFVPLAAFDRCCFRLGYGAGFYDGALARLRATKPVLAVGVAFAVQQVAAVPREPHDQRLDLVVTETETLIAEPD